MELKGSKTEANLWKAFAGESQARNKYTYFASKAKKDCYNQIAAIFEETAKNEMEHAKLWFKHLGGINDTYENLLAAAAGENEEWTDMYPTFEKEAREEGFDAIANVFHAIAIAEKMHEDRYLKLAKNIEDGTVFKKDEPVLWKCNNCGFTVESLAAPERCPACDHPQAHFEAYTFFKG